MSDHLIAKEISVLMELGKITQNGVDEIAVTDMPATWRLACQFIARDEGILVEY